MVASALVRALNSSSDQLKRDNITLSEDKERMQSAMSRLQRTIALGKILDNKLAYKLERDIDPESDKHQFWHQHDLKTARQELH